MVVHRYTEEEHNFLKSFVAGHTHKEITEEFNKIFQASLSVGQIKSYIKRHKLLTGNTGRFEKGHVPHNKGTHPPTVGRMAETQYKKGNLPHNTKPIGYERITKDGYIEVKIKMRPSHKDCNDNFKLKHRLIWEEAHGPVPKGHKIIFLDGNKQNCSLENLTLVTDAEHLQMTRQNLRSNDSKFSKTGVLIAKLGVKTKKLKKEKNNEN